MTFLHMLSKDESETWMCRYQETQVTHQLSESRNPISSSWTQQLFPTEVSSKTCAKLSL